MNEFKSPGVAKILLGMYMATCVIALLWGMFEIKSDAMFSLGFFIVAALGLPWTYIFFKFSKTSSMFVGFLWLILPVIVNAAIFWFLFVRNKRQQ